MSHDDKVSEAFVLREIAECEALAEGQKEFLRRLAAQCLVPSADRPCENLNEADLRAGSGPVGTDVHGRELAGRSVRGNPATDDAVLGPHGVEPHSAAPSSERATVLEEAALECQRIADIGGGPQGVTRATALWLRDNIRALKDKPASATSPSNGTVYLLDGKPHRLCGCDPMVPTCRRGGTRTLQTCGFSQCLVPAPDALLVSTDRADVTK